MTQASACLAIIVHWHRRRSARAQALATACVFLATKIDSAYHRLDSVAHACFRALRALQQREPEPEYYNADGVSAAAAASAAVLWLYVFAARGVVASMINV